MRLGDDFIVAWDKLWNHAHKETGNRNHDVCCTDNNFTDKYCTNACCTTGGSMKGSCLTYSTTSGTLPSSGSTRSTRLLVSNVNYVSSTIFFWKKNFLFFLRSIIYLEYCKDRWNIIQSIISDQPKLDFFLKIVSTE